ncbi:endo-1,4-beta-xylanase [Mesorhizobium sp. KR2-14]|uniref:endo-1,4-beta-xylanase n=1 Tax=Mesorhizobium sp. KR2-14 TaxID=3156610 RepID=UPI0032B33A5A
MCDVQAVRLRSSNEWRYTRRAVIAGTVGFASAALSVQAKAGPSLKVLAEQGGLFFGAAVTAEALRLDSSFRSAVLNECSSVTPEISLKWGAVEPLHARLEMAAMDEIAEVARVNGLRVYGHALLWHGSVPQWAEAMLGDSPDWRYIRNYFSSVMPRYGDVVRYWDVVNEPLEPGHRDDGLRANAFLRAFGPVYIERAMREARLFAPDGKLMINEYGLEYDIPVEGDRRYLFLKLIEDLKSKSVPLDGIGLQAHLDLRKGKIFAKAIREFLREIEELGLVVVVTELDVKEADYAASLERRDGAVADETRRYLEVVLDSPAVRGISTWGLSDRYSWLRLTEDELASYTGTWNHEDGQGLNRGLPLDAILAPKRMYAAVARTLARRDLGR